LSTGVNIVDSSATGETHIVLYDIDIESIELPVGHGTFNPTRPVRDRVPAGAV
jgi:hypothetical protein